MPASVTIEVAEAGGADDGRLSQLASYSFGRPATGLQFRFEVTDGTVELISA